MQPLLSARCGSLAQRGCGWVWAGSAELKLRILDVMVLAASQGRFWSHGGGDARQLVYPLGDAHLLWQVCPVPTCTPSASLSSHTLAHSKRCSA